MRYLYRLGLRYLWEDGDFFSACLRRGVWCMIHMYMRRLIEHRRDTGVMRCKSIHHAGSVVNNLLKCRLRRTCEFSVANGMGQFFSLVLCGCVWGKIVFCEAITWLRLIFW